MAMKALRRSSVMLLVLLVSSCTDPIDQGLDSLEGEWDIDQITIDRSEVRDLGAQTLDELTYVQPDGIFAFTLSEIDYDYTLDGMDTQINESYTLTSEKVNSGFTKVREFTLELETQLFDVDFGDGTRDSFEEAEAMVLTEVIEVDSIRTTTRISLTKRE